MRVLLVILALIVPILIYGGLGWIVSDIYFSMADIEKMTIHEYNMTILWIRNIICSLFCYIVLQIKDNWRNIDFDSDIFSWVLVVIPLVLAYVMNYIPVSAGAGWLILIVCLLDMMFCEAWCVADDLN